MLFPRLRSRMHVELHGTIPITQEAFLTDDSLRQNLILALGFSLGVNEIIQTALII